MAQKRYAGHYSTRREGLVSELPFRERAKMNLRHHKWQTKRFLEKHGVLVIGGVALAAYIYLKTRDAQAKVGGHPLLTP